MGPADHRERIAAVRGFDQTDALRDHVESLGPAHLDQHPVASDQRRGQPILGAQVLEAETVLVRQPSVVGGVVVHTDQPQDLVLAGVDRDPGMGGVVESGALHHHQIPGPGAEAVLGRGEGANRADLDRVAGEVGGEGEVGEGVDLRRVAPVLELDQRVPADLLAEPGAAGAEDASLPIEQDQVGDGDRLLVIAFDLDESALPGTVGEGLVLQRALSALVAYRAIERVIGEQELEHTFLGLLHRRAAGLDDHPVGDRVGAGCHQHRASGPLDLDQAHPAHPDRLHPLVPAEPRDVGPLVLGGLDQQRPGSDLVLHPVDGDLDQLCHARASTCLNGQPPSSTWALTSSRK